MEQGSGDDDMEENPAEWKGKEPIPALLPRLVPDESAMAEEGLPRLVVQLSNLELPEEREAPTSSPWIREWPWGTSYFVAAWIGPLGPLRVFASSTAYPAPWLRSLFCCRFCLPIDRAVKGAELCLELVRKERRPRDPATSGGVRVAGRARVKLGVPEEGRRARRGFVLPWYSYSPAPAFVGSIRVDMELVI